VPLTFAYSLNVIWSWVVCSNWPMLASGGHGQRQWILRPRSTPWAPVCGLAVSPVSVPESRIAAWTRAVRPVAVGTWLPGVAVGAGDAAARRATVSVAAAIGAVLRQQAVEAEMPVATRAPVAGRDVVASVAAVVGHRGAAEWASLGGAVDKIKARLVAEVQQLLQQHALQQQRAVAGAHACKSLKQPAGDDALGRVLLLQLAQRAADRERTGLQRAL
jgi:hypothetical protein